ncbi:MAG: hypothetical protein WCB99_11665 [Candidatus Cybelea sp.]|jgi:hypothetical protein
MADAKTEVKDALEAHGRAIDDLYHKLAAVATCDKEKLERAITKYKAAHKVFHEDALGCVGF